MLFREMENSSRQTTHGYLFGVFSVLGVVTAIPTVVMYTDASCYKRAMPASYTITGLV